MGRVRAQAVQGAGVTAAGGLAAHLFAQVHQQGVVLVVQGGIGGQVVREQPLQLPVGGAVGWPNPIRPRMCRV